MTHEQSAAKVAHDCETILSVSLGLLSALESAIQGFSTQELQLELTGRITGEIIAARDYLQRVNHPPEEADFWGE